ncbi:hypothetical protein D3C87_1694980 [compost metagenome]
MVVSMAANYVTFVRKLFDLLFGHVIYKFAFLANGNRHDKIYCFVSVFFKGWCGNSKLVHVCIVKSEHDRFRWQRYSCV